MIRPMDLLAAMQAFVHVVDTGGFTQAAAVLRQTQPAVSKQVAALEARLGARLLHRSTRSVTPTEEGRAFYGQARRSLDAASEALASVGERSGTVDGTVRLACPVAFGRLQVLPRLATLLERHPALAIDLTMSDGFVDLVEGGIDLGIRIGTLTDPGLIARRIGTTRRVTVASPAYLARAGEPALPDALAGHDCILYAGLATGDVWHFDEGGREIAVRVAGRFRANNSEAVREAVLAGLGIAVCPIWLFGPELDGGQVRLLLPGFEPTPLPIHAIRPSRRFEPRRIRAVLDHFVSEFARASLLGGISGPPT